MVYYRKYRPQKISELDSQEVREKLYSIFPEDSPHAFLFTGPKGLGKTSTARIIAKVVNCERNSKVKIQKSKPQLKTQNYENEEIEPCNKCTQCMSITSGTNLDVLEIDGASNRGIDEIRDLREKIRLSPLSAKKKVYIIDEVHMLTTEAFNALLKTLEEPPDHAIFILCTTESHKVPETILSRCFHISFNKATNEELVHSLTRIAEGEHLKVDKEAFEEIARLSDGGFRDGTKILEELAFLSRGEPITLKLLEEKYQISNIKYQMSEMLGLMVNKDTKGAIDLVSKLVIQGVDMKYFIEQMINDLHEELLMKIGVTQNHQSPITNHQFTVVDIKRLVELLTKAHGELKYSILPQLPLELAVLEWGEVTPMRGPVTPFPSASAPSSLPANSYAVAGGSNEVRAVGSPSRRATPSDAEKLGDEVQRSSAYSSASFSDKTNVKKINDNDDLWSDFISKVKVHNHSIAGVLRSCSLGDIDDKEIVIKAGYKFHKDKLEDKKTLDILEKAWEEIAGKKVKIMIELKSK